MEQQWTSGNADLMKQMNRSTVLSMIRNYGPISKAEIAEKSKLTFASVSNIISDLHASNLIVEIGYGGSSGGRKPVLYNLKADSFYVIGLELGISHIRAVIVDLNASILVDHVVDTLSSSGSDSVIQQIYKAIDYVVTQVDQEKIAGIGISSPGPVDTDLGIVLAPPNLAGWSQVPLKELIYQRYGWPTMLEKDANASALGEQWFGSAKGKDNVIFVLADQGIGGGIIIGGRVYRGFYHGAGEIGHGTIDVDGPRCNCGNYGCLEAMASGIAVLRRVKEEIRRGVPSSLLEANKITEEELTLDHVIQSALDGDSLSQSILNEAGRLLGIGVATIINFFSPQAIILGGELVNGYPKMIEVVREIAHKRCYSHFAERVTIQESLLGRHAGVIGAASLAIQHLFDNTEQILLQQNEL